MNTRERLIMVLGASLAINAVLIILIIWLIGENRSSEQVQTSQDEWVNAVVATLAPMIAANNAAGPTGNVTSIEAELERGSATIAEVDLPTLTPTAVPTTTPIPSPTPTEAPKLTPTPLPSPTIEPTLPPTETPLPSPPPEPTAVPTIAGPGWLQYLNAFRAEAGLPFLTENPEWSEGSRLHSVYMAYDTGYPSHYENPANPYYSEAGQQAGENSNIAVNNATTTEYEWAMNYWMSAPFHAVPMLDPLLTEVGFGTHTDMNAPTAVAATIDIERGRMEELPDGIAFPILFPQDGGQAWVRRYSLPEYPDPRAYCGYAGAVGAPIIAIWGDGDQTPVVNSSSLRQGDTFVDHCVFDELTYTHSDLNQQTIGRNILDSRDAVIVLPSRPLEPGQTVTVDLVVNGTPVTWSFETVSPPTLP